MEGDETPSEGPGPPGSRPTTAGSGSSAVGSPGASATAYAPPGGILWHQRAREQRRLPSDPRARRRGRRMSGRPRGAPRPNQRAAARAPPRRCALHPRQRGGAGGGRGPPQLGATTGTRFTSCCSTSCSASTGCADVVGWVREAAGPTVPSSYSRRAQLELVRALPPTPRARAPRRPPPCRARRTPHRPRAAARRAAAASTRLTPHRTTALVCGCGAASCSAPTRCDERSVQLPPLPLAVPPAARPRVVRRRRPQPPPAPPPPPPGESPGDWPEASRAPPSPWRSPTST